VLWQSPCFEIEHDLTRLSKLQLMFAFPHNKDLLGNFLIVP